MKMLKPAGRGAVLLLVVSLITIPVSSQQRTGNIPPRPSPATTRTGPSPAKRAEPTFDTLLAGDSYAVYGEVRMLGQQGRSGGLFQVLEPLRSIAGAPKELREFFNFLDTHADILSGSRMMFATEPGRMPLPEGVAAVELSSAEAAQKFEPELRSLLTKLNSTAATTNAPSPGGTKKPARAVAGEAAKTRPGAAAPATSFFIRRAGKLIVVSETPFTLESLRPEKSRALSDEPNFLMARNRLSSESLFLYFNVELMERLNKQQREKYEAEAKERERAQQKDAARLKNRTKTIRENNNQTEHTVPADTQVVTSQPNGEIGAVSSSSVTVTNAPSDQSSEPPPPAPADSGVPARTENGADQLTMLAPLLFRFAFGDFGGEIKMPQAVGAAATLEGDALIVRALLLNTPGKQVKPIPFIPLLISGSPLAPQAPAVLPADTEIFISASLDPSQIYGTLLRVIGNSETGGSPEAKPATEEKSPTLRIAAFEKLVGFSIKEDLLPTLGSEVAISIPGTSFRGSPTNPAGAPPATQSGAVFLISLRDRDKLQTILPRAFEALGLKSSGQAGQTSDHGGVEIDNYGPFTLAFVNNFLVVGQNATDISRVADAYTKQETLAANNDFRAWTGWQPRQSLMQVYASPKFIRSLFAEAERTINQGGDDEAKISLSRLNLDLGAITHAVTSEGRSSILHELHLPKDLLMLLMTEEAFYSRQAPVINGEAMAIYTLKAINEAETKYQSTKGKGTFATLDELASEKLIPVYLLRKDKYEIEITVSGNKFEATATPVEYGKTGRRSFFLDETKIIRGADHGGARATAEDEPVQ